MLAGQQGQTDLAGLEVHVRVAYRGDEVDLRRGERVIWRDRDGQEPQTVGVGRGVVLGTLEHGFPLEEVGVGRGAQVQDGVAGLGLQRGELVREPLEGVVRIGFPRGAHGWRKGRRRRRRRLTVGFEVCEAG